VPPFRHHLYVLHEHASPHRRRRHRSDTRLAPVHLTFHVHYAIGPLPNGPGQDLGRLRPGPLGHGAAAEADAFGGRVHQRGRRPGIERAPLFWGADNYESPLKIKAKLDPGNVLQVYGGVGWDPAAPTFQCYSKEANTAATTSHDMGEL